MTVARYGHARVSTRSQKDDSQLDALTSAGCKRIWTDTASGRLARRPEWDKCLDDLHAGDELVVTRLSRTRLPQDHLPPPRTHHRGDTIITDPMTCSIASWSTSRDRSNDSPAP